MQPHVLGRALVAIAAVVGQATAQQPGTTQPPQPPASPAARSVADRCVDLMSGRVPPGEDVAALRAQCEGLLRRSGPAAGEPGVQAGVATAAPAPGPSAPTSFTQTPQELAAPGGLGTTRRGPVQNTLLTDPLGWFSGLGVNASYTRPFRWDRASWLAGARYSRTNAQEGHVTTFGLGTGADLFLYGRNNEGIRIGPRLDLAFGREDIEEDASTDFARLGVSAELGYNYIAASGISAAVMGGYGGRLAGDEQDENFTSYTGGEDGPYLRLGVGYSW